MLIRDRFAASVSGSNKGVRVTTRAAAIRSAEGGVPGYECYGLRSSPYQGPHFCNSCVFRALSLAS